MNSAISAYNLAIVAASNVTVLNASKATAAGLITLSGAESTTPGDYVVGSLATLVLAQTAANATSASAQSVVDGQVTTLNSAISAYNLAIVGPDIIAPIVTLSGSATLTLAFGAVYTELGARWVDVVDGSGAATVSGSLNTSIAGVYVLSYKKTDIAGNMSNTVTRTVTVSPAPVSSGGGGGGGSSSSTPPIVLTIGTGSTQYESTAVQLAIVTPSSNPNIAQDTFVRKDLKLKKLKVMTTTTTLKKGTTINVFRVLPNGKSIKVGTTKVLPNGEIRFPTKIAGTYKLEQK